MRTKFTFRLKPALLLLATLLAPPLLADYTDPETGITYPGTYNAEIDEFILDPACTRIQDNTLPNVKRIVIPGNEETWMSSYALEGHNKLEELIFLDGCGPDITMNLEFNECTNLRKIRFNKNFKYYPASESRPSRLATLLTQKYENRTITFLPIEEVSVSTINDIQDILINGKYYSDGQSIDYSFTNGNHCPDGMKLVIRDECPKSFAAQCRTPNGRPSVPSLKIEINQPVNGETLKDNDFLYCKLSKIAIEGQITAAIFQNCCGLENLSIQHLTGFVGNLFGVPNKNDDNVTSCYQTITQHKEDGTFQTSYIPKDLATLAFTEGCEEIPYGALSNCTSLERITIAASVFKVGEKALYGCAKLKDIYMEGAEPPVAFDNSFEGMRMSSCRLHVPAGCAEAYRNAPGWKQFSLIEEDGAAVQVSVSKTIENGGVVYGLKSYDRGDVCELTAMANSGYTFAGWYDAEGSLITQSPILQHTVTSSMSVVADFRANVGLGGSTATTESGSAVVTWPAVSGAAGYDIQVFASNDPSTPVKTIHVDANGNQSRSDKSSSTLTVTVLDLPVADYVYRINVLDVNGVATDQMCGEFSITESGLLEIECDTTRVDVIPGTGVCISDKSGATDVRITGLSGVVMHNGRTSSGTVISLPRGFYIIQLPEKSLKIKI